jgi:TIR domain
MKIVQRGRLKLGQIGGSIGIPPGMGYQAHRITVSNTEGGYPNTCDNVRAEVVLTFVHTGEEKRMAGLFAQTDGQKITSEPRDSIVLKMLESSQLLLLCRDSINSEFHTLTGWPFDPASERRLEFGDWRLEITVSSDSRKDVDCAAYEVRLKPDLSSAWSPLKEVGPDDAKPAPSPTPRAFVSHSSQDHVFVEGFAADLRANGVDAWYSGWEIKPGDSIRKKIDDGLGDCEFFIIVLSKNSITRPWVQTELDAATVGKLTGKVRKIIPIKIEDCGILPPTLASLCWEDFSTRPYRSALQRVLDSIFDRDVRPALGSPPTVKSTPQGHLRITSLSNRSPDFSEQRAMPEARNLAPIHMDDLGSFADRLRGEGFDA